MNALIRERPYTPISYIHFLLLGVGTDLTLFYVLSSIGVMWNTAHVLSFMAEAVVISILWGFWLPQDLPAEGFMRRVLGYGIIQLLALFLRGGFLAALVEAESLSPTMAIIPAVLVSSAVVLLGTHLWLFQGANGRSEEDAWSRRRTVAILTYAIALRVVYSWTFELLHEEAYYWNYAQHLDIGYLDHPPMVGWLIWIFTTLLGHTEFPVRLGALLCWLIAAYYVYKLTYDVFGAAVAFRAFLLTTVLPLFFGTGLVMTPDAPLVACWAGALYYLYRSLVEKGRWAWLQVGVFMGLGMLSKYTIALLGLSLLVFMLTDRNARKWFVRPEPYLGLFVTILLFLPVIIWNVQQDWASFDFQSTRRLAEDFHFALPELIGSALALLTPTGLVAAVAAIVSRESILPGSMTPKTTRTHRFLLTTTVVPFSVFFFFSLFRLSKLNWTAPIWLGALPYIAAVMVPGRSSTTPEHSSLAERLPRCVASAWPATIIFFLALYGAILHYTVLGLPGVPYHQDLVGIGIPDFARQVATLEEDFERQNGKKPFIVCMDTDRLAGWIAFYRVKMLGSAHQSRVKEIIENTTGGHLFGRRSHMYRFWHPVETYDKQRPLLVLAVRRRDLLKKQVTERINPISDIEERVLWKHGRPTTRFFYQFAEMRYS